LFEKEISQSESKRLDSVINLLLDLHWEACPSKLRGVLNKARTLQLIEFVKPRLSSDDFLVYETAFWFLLLHGKRVSVLFTIEDTNVVKIGGTMEVICGLVKIKQNKRFHLNMSAEDMFDIVKITDPHLQGLIDQLREKASKRTNKCLFAGFSPATANELIHDCSEELLWDQNLVWVLHCFRHAFVQDTERQLIEKCIATQRASAADHATQTPQTYLVNEANRGQHASGPTSKSLERTRLSHNTEHLRNFFFSS
jgi:hypothetical protein